MDETAVDPSRHDLSYLEGGSSGTADPTSQPGRYFDGIAANARVIGISKTQLLDSDAQSPFHSTAANTSYAHLPAGLQPTSIQQQYPHHPFFDCIPLPGFRDRAILAGATKPPLLNRFVICFDMFAGGLNFTGDPSLEQSWCFSRTFREKWGKLIDFDLEELQRRANESATE